MDYYRKIGVEVPIQIETKICYYLKVNAKLYN